ncbi:hypothetical protein CCR85_05150 [Rhodothalassium salexigens]|uniref:Uncharacterized protein n=2 Tax=Rhodothalassium salexigens TaxID=1086 RepID=A0A4R2PCL6_RHOSA|nr:hypothetical protein [Rhodothalassium salexigens]MBK1638099.1 hypothetical protein [Rhodothalassium salexigens DSM 2132]MBK5910879.1 hypothetical protein [Rhodothalassium salexigens]MBK5920166.1 hypothetical protein [Rhodothalassium salexigens]TCP32923.1 hypothetical protein EV659_10822 [Rhodothalassium salexigens DSM 2132]
MATQAQIETTTDYDPIGRKAPTGARPMTQAADPTRGGPRLAFTAILGLSALLWLGLIASF